MTPDTSPDLLERLARDRLTPIGRIVSASNFTLLCDLGSDGTRAIYKPERGEAPLWDFPPCTLHLREVAAYVIDDALGWGMVPPTVRRDEGPYGNGSVQLFIDHDPERHYFTLADEGDVAVVEQLQRMVLFDVVINNADRKGSHVLLDDAGRVRLVDHGICFHVEHKLRTVAWDFAGEPVPDEHREQMGALAGRLADPAAPTASALAELLSVEEIAATATRAAAAARARRYPQPVGPRPVPWPPL